jgi:superfamily II DNA or RNA helicase
VLNTPIMAPSVISTIALRPYQQECVERVLTACQQQPRGGKTLLVLPTGGGKTIVFTEIARRLGLNTLIIAHRQELLQQAADKFRLVDPTVIIGQVGAGRHEWGAPVTVASVQTISRPEHLKQLKLFGYGLIIIDECHHAAAEGYRAVLDALPDAFVLGVTATSDRLDKQSIESIFGEPVFSASIIDMVEQGYLCDLRAIAVRTTTSLDDVHTQAGDFKTDELEEVIDTPERNARVVEAYLEHCAGRQALCFGVTVAHAQHLAETFQEKGVLADMVSGETAPEERKRILHAYERGDLAVLCNCGVLTEGYDAPQTSCVIMARPTKSRALYVQCIGRGTRLAPGKQDCIILDITDNCLKHRLEPLALTKALGKILQDGESITDAKKREIIEEEERERQERTTRVTARAADLSVNVLARMDWKRGRTGIYTLEVGENKHRILLVPSDDTDGYYSVWAKLAPDFKGQQWLKDSPLDWAQQHAEMKARLLQTSEKKLILVDNNAPWRSRPASDRQVWMMRKFDIEFTEDTTAGEASDLIGQAIAEEKKRKTEKATEKAAGRTKSQRGRKKARASA